jgi:tetratricopeptide (TPR) repeat protein
VKLPAAKADEPLPVRIEVLASTVSPHAGFQSLRADPLKRTTDPQEFKFPASAARWLMVRFTPAADAKSLSIGELGIRGQVGEPKSNYSFKQAPTDAVAVVAKLQKLSTLDLAVMADETAMFAGVKDGKFTSCSFAEAALIASGVTDAEKRETYLTRIDELEIEARTALKVAEPKESEPKEGAEEEPAEADAEKPTAPAPPGEVLLKWLHGAALQGGYEEHQTKLDVLLDTGKFNCVSSAVLYNILAIRLGLDARAIEVPDHAFSIVYDGADHADVETTSPRGFNPSRDPATQAMLARLTGFAYVPESHRDQRREVREAGLTAVIYYNRGVVLAEERKYPAALLCYFRAMCLDREFDSSVKNALTTLGRWSLECAEAERFAEGIEVLSAGLELAPEDAEFLHNRKAFFALWASAAAKAGNDDEALRVLRKAAAEVASDAEFFLAQEPWIFIERGEAKIEAKEWEQALAAVEPGFAKVSEKAVKQLQEWRRDLYLRWANALLDERKFDEGIKVLLKGRAAAPQDGLITNNLLYLLQEGLAQADGAKAAALLQTHTALLTEIPEGRDVALNYVGRLLDKAQQENRYPDAIAIVERHAKIIGDEAKTKELVLGNHDAWAQHLGEQGDWSAALEVYAQGLKRFPKDPHLLNNLVATFQQGVAVTNEKKGAAEAKALLARTHKRFPGMPQYHDIALGHVQRQVQKLLQQKDYAAALAALDDHAEVMVRAGDVENTASVVFDNWALAHLDKKEFREAADVLGRALKAYPKSEHFQENSAVVFNNWAKTFIDEMKWSEAIAVYKEGLGRHPDDAVLKQNLEFCMAKSEEPK